MKFLYDLEDQIAKPGWLTRRALLNRLVKSCAALAAVAAGIPLKEAAACSNCQCHGTPNNACCCLCWPNNFCKSDYYSGQCPCSDTPYQWYCTYNGCHIVCGECYNCCCSYAYQLCSIGCPCDPQAPSADIMTLLVPKRTAATCH